MEMLAQLTVASLLIYEKQEEYEQNVIIIINFEKPFFGNLTW
jgi:hypothetical protein